MGDIAKTAALIGWNLGVTPVLEEPFRRHIPGVLQVGECISVGKHLSRNRKVLLNQLPHSELKTVHIFPGCIGIIIKGEVVPVTKGVANHQPAVWKNLNSGDVEQEAERASVDTGSFR